MDPTAIGVPVLTGPAEGWNFWPLIAIPVALTLTFGWLRLPRRLWTVALAVVAGLVMADAVAAWGVVPVAAGVGAMVLVGRLIALRAGGPGRPAV